MRRRGNYCSERRANAGVCQNWRYSQNQVSTLVTVDANGTFIHSNKNNDLYRAASWRPFIARRMVASGRMIGQVKLSREAPSFVAHGAHPVVIFLHTT